METYEIIIAVILALISIISFVIAYFQYQEKGLLLNNASLYSSKEELSKLNKKPYYRQSAVVFLLIGFIFLINAIDVVIKTKFLFYGVIGLIVITILYAIISSVRIAKKH